MSFLQGLQGKTIFSINHEPCMYGCIEHSILEKDPCSYTFCSSISKAILHIVYPEVNSLSLSLSLSHTSFIFIYCRTAVIKNYSYYTPNIIFCLSLQEIIITLKDTVSIEITSCMIHTVSKRPAFQEVTELTDQIELLWSLEFIRFLITSL